MTYDSQARRAAKAARSDAEDAHILARRLARRVEELEKKDREREKEREELRAAFDALKKEVITLRREVYPTVDETKPRLKPADGLGKRNIG